MPEREQAYRAMVDDLVRQARRIPESTARSVLGLLDDARRDIVARIASAPSGSFSETQLRMLLHEVDRQLREFALLAGREVGRGQARSFAAGAEMVDRPLAAAGVQPASLIGLSRQTLATAQGYSASLITGVTRKARSQIDSTLRRALLGGQPLGDIVDQVGRALSGGAAPSIFSAAGSRALTIVRTEVPRMLSVATQARLEDVAERLGPGAVKKSWRHSPQEHPRLSHVALDGTAVEVGESFEMESGELLRFPRDPRGTARETVNCACTVAPQVLLPERRVRRHVRVEIAA
jgi:hypothetical protein